MLLGLCLLAQDSTLVPEFTRFALSRERVGHKVVAEGVLSAPADVEFKDLRLTFIYFEGTRELKRSDPVDRALLPPGSNWTFKAEAAQVEKFDRYEAWLDASGRRVIYESRDLTSLPAPRKNPPAKAVVIAASDERPASFPGDVEIRLVIRNDSPGAAKEPVASLIFDGARTLRVPLGASIDAWSEDTWVILLPQSETYSRIESAIAWLEGEMPGLGNPTAAAKDVGLIRCRVMKLSDGSARLLGTLKNGRAAAVDHVRVDVQVGHRDAAHPVAGALAPGAAREVDIYVPGVASLDGASYSLAFEEAPSAKPALEPRKPFARRTGTRRLEPPAIAPATAAPARQEPAAPAALTTELRGVMVVEGLTVKNFNKTAYTGDVLYLKLLFRDAKGEIAKPVGVLNASILTATERLAAVSRTIKKEHYKTEAARITPATAAPDLLAFDEKTGELWVGLTKTAAGVAELRLEVTFRVVGAGTWEWKKLAPPFEAAARPPDKK